MLLLFDPNSPSSPSVWPLKRCGQVQAAKRLPQGPTEASSQHLHGPSPADAPLFPVVWADIKRKFLLSYLWRPLRKYWLRKTRFVVSPHLSPVQNTARQCLSNGNWECCLSLFAVWHSSHYSAFNENRQNCKDNKALLQMDFHIWVWQGNSPLPEYPVKQLLYYCLPCLVPILNTTKSYCKNMFLSSHTKFSVSVYSRPAVLPLFTEIVPNCFGFVIFFPH